MNRISIHPASLAVGLVFGSIVLLSMSQTPPLNARNVNLQYLPDPRDMVQIQQGASFVVPVGRLFVLTGLGSVGSCGQVASLSVNGQVEVSGGVSFTGGVTGSAIAQVSSIAPVPPGLTVPAGSTITVIGGGCDGRAWGYLAPQ